MSIEKLIIPEGYVSKLSLLETQIAIKKIKNKTLLAKFFILHSFKFYL